MTRNREFDALQLRGWAEQAESFWLDIRQALIPYADRFFQSLSEGQKSALISHWRERFEERMEDVAEADSERAEVMIERLESSLGRVTSSYDVKCASDYPRGYTYNRQQHQSTQSS